METKVVLDTVINFLQHYGLIVYIVGGIIAYPIGQYMEEHKHDFDMNVYVFTVIWPIILAIVIIGATLFCLVYLVGYIFSLPTRFASWIVVPFRW